MHTSDRNTLLPIAPKIRINIDTNRELTRIPAYGTQTNIASNGADNKGIRKTTVLPIRYPIMTHIDRLKDNQRLNLLHSFSVLIIPDIVASSDNISIFSRNVVTITVMSPGGVHGTPPHRYG